MGRQRATGCGQRSHAENRHVPPQEPDRAEAACTHPPRAAWEGRPRRPGARPHDPPCKARPCPTLAFPGMGIVLSVRGSMHHRAVDGGCPSLICPTWPTSCVPHPTRESSPPCPTAAPSLPPPWPSPPSLPTPLSARLSARSGSGPRFTTTTNAMFLMPDLLKPEGIEAEIINFPSLVQRMQAVASGGRWTPAMAGCPPPCSLPPRVFPCPSSRMAATGGGCWWPRLPSPSFGQLAGKRIGGAERVHRAGQPELEAAPRGHPGQGGARVPRQPGSADPARARQRGRHLLLRAVCHVRRAQRVSGTSCGCRTTRRWARRTSGSSRPCRSSPRTRG